MSSCSSCRNWITRRFTRYGDGVEIDQASFVDGRGACAVLKIETAAEFGCNAFVAGDDHAEITLKTGAPWQHFVMIPCPDCAGRGDGGSGHRCAGTGLVRLYDDGHIGDEQTRMHPKEKQVVPPPQCHACQARIDVAWKHCPACGAKLLAVAETEIVENVL